jgi:hypothetical protein
MKLTLEQVQLWAKDNGFMLIPKSVCLPIDTVKAIAIYAVHGEDINTKSRNQYAVFGRYLAANYLRQFFTWRDVATMVRLDAATLKNAFDKLAEPEFLAPWQKHSLSIFNQKINETINTITK